MLISARPPVNVSFPTLPPSISAAMEQFDRSYLQSIESAAPTVARALAHLGKGKGKRLRPLIVFLVARAFGVKEEDDAWEDVIGGAIAIELLHLASLIHDDVIDESRMRRGELSLYALLGPHKAVLFGDYILSHAFTRALLIGSQVLALTLSELGMQLSEGELLQEDMSELSVTTEEQYLEIISRKTASLIKASFRIGLETAGVKDGAVIRSVSDAAERIGLAFQIKDDIFDYAPTADLGKPSGNDLREHKVTLPLIFALGSGAAESSKAAKLLKKKELSGDEIRFLVQFARKNGGIEYATAKMNALVTEAKALLQESIPGGEELETLMELCDYIVYRDR